VSDITIPGISNKSGIDTSKLVEDLMEVERIPVRRMEREVETYELQRETWQSLGRQVARLRDTARTMYGFENPFRDRIASSSNESVVQATATRQAIEGIDEIVVLQTAGRDRFASQPLSRDYRVPPGRYEFTVGEDTRSFRFAGGSLRDFSTELNRRLDGIVRSTVVPDTPSTQIIIFEGQKEGAQAQMSFGEDGVSFMREIGVMSPPRPDKAFSLLEDAPLLLKPGQTEQLRLPTPFEIQPGMVLRFEARSVNLDRDEWTAPEAPPGVEPVDPGATSLKDVTIRNEALGFNLPEPEAPEPPPFREDNRAMKILGDGVEQELPPLPETGTFSQVEISGEDLLSRMRGFSFHNLNTHRNLEIRNLTVLDPTTRSGSTPTNALETARDARLRYSGVEIQRSTNAIDDLIPGVTLNLRRSSPDPIEIDVQPDRERAKEKIIEFIGYYNQVIRDINIYTRTDRALIDQIEYFSDSERETMEKRLGVFQGDSSLQQLRNRLQTIMMNPYDAGPDSSFRLLAEIGISTNASGGGGGYDGSRLRGYLEISETDLDSALAADFESVGRLFGRDSTGDLTVDTGVAVALEQYVGPYVRTGGIIAGRTDGINTRIDQTQNRISRYNDRLEDYEQKLRTDFGRMEGMMQQLEGSTEALDRLNIQGTQDRR
jgi:flagellar hook-associated protein 2